MIIDVHTHVGSCRVYDETVLEDDLWRSMQAHGADVSLVQPLFVTPNESSQRAAHDRVAAFVALHPGKAFGIASLNPHCDLDVYRTELRRCIKDLHFVAVKLHPTAHACNPLSRDGRAVFAAAHELGIPVLVHTGLGIPFALPSLLIPIAKEIPQLKIILGHSGMLMFAQDAMVAAAQCENLYLETSWTPASQIAMIADVFPSRIVFGSDQPSNLSAEVAKIDELKGSLTQEQLENWMWRTARNVFKLQLE